ncbi:MAG TPA: TadE/TadG family type IV pilus assembly protein [Alphaproteobacteria bacterium]|nr:TadE/TadG family type IV pilus assembly protein [Alphaproteobacteria bacterium]
MRTSLRRLSSDIRGSFLAEFAAAMPVLVLLFLGGIEVSRFALLNQKMDRVATAMGDLVAQAETLSETELNQLFLAVNHVASPFDIMGNGTVIVSSMSIPPPARVGDPPNPPKITWQRKTGSLIASSQIGAQGARPTLPAGLTLADKQTIIAAEVYYEFRPMLISALVPGQEIYHRAFFRPRLGALTALSP